MRRPSILVALAAIFVLGHLSGSLLGCRPSDPADVAGTVPAGEPSAAPPLGVTSASAQGSPGFQLSPSEERNVTIFRELSPSVVFISNIAQRRSPFSFNVLETPQGTGTGFFWDNKGHIVTNFHVLQGGSRFNVVLSDQTEWDAEFVGGAPNKDLAVLRIGAPRDKLRPIPLGSSRNLMVGQEVLAIGNPFGLDQTLTVGIVSALGRELTSPGGRTIRDVVQTDAAINPGNSGGPLLDGSGRLIGVNTAIYSPTGASAGIGFAVPVDTIARLVPQLIENGKPVQPGIGFLPAPDSWARRLGIEGVIVQGVERGSPADKAGIEGLWRSRRGRLMLGDVITEVNGEAVPTVDDLILAFEAAGVGASVRVTLERDRESRRVDVVLVAVN